MNNELEKKFLQLIEFKGEKNEIDKFKSYINDIETITTIFLKLSCRLAKIENDLLTLTDDNAQAKVNINSIITPSEKKEEVHSATPCHTSVLFLAGIYRFLFKRCL